MFVFPEELTYTANDTKKILTIYNPYEFDVEYRGVCVCVGEWVVWRGGVCVCVCVCACMRDCVCTCVSVPCRLHSVVSIILCSSIWLGL